MSCVRSPFVSFVRNHSEKLAQTATGNQDDAISDTSLSGLPATANFRG